VLSFTRAALVVKVSGGFTLDPAALPGHLAVAWAPAGFGGR